MHTYKERKILTERLEELGERQFVDNSVENFSKGVSQQRVGEISTGAT